MKAKPVPAYVSWDIRGTLNGSVIAGRYGKPWTVEFGVNTLTNALPPLATRAFPDNNADVSTYSPIGRLFYVGLNGVF